MAGPLQGIRIVEVASIGPGPFCGMMLADMGADVVRIERPAPLAPKSASSAPDWADGVDLRGRRIVTLDLKQAGAPAQALELIAQADGLIEGFRPGVMERMGLGPDVCMERNKALVYGRMTGWGQHGPLAHCAGHDINYVALSGALHAVGPAGQPPVVPLNYVGDYGGGAMMLAFGMVCAFLEARQSGRGQVIDAAMTDGAALLSAAFYSLKAQGRWNNDRGENLLDGGAHFYGTYQCSDGKYIAVGAIEPQFYADLLRRCGIEDTAFDAQFDPRSWPVLKLRLADLFRGHTRDEWCARLEGTDACFAPVLDWDEAPLHAHNRARETFVEVDGVVQPAPAPRFSRTPALRPGERPTRHVPAGQVLQEWRSAR